MEAKKRYHGQLNRAYMTDGNVAHKVTDYLDPGQALQREQQEQDNRQAEENAKKAKNPRPGIIMDISPAWMILLVAAIAITLYTCLGYLKVQADIVVANKAISRLESQLKDMQTRNEAAYNAVVEAVDFDEVYRVAVGELGMVFPNKNRVLTYQVDASGYVRQYADIPDADRLNAIRELIPFETD